jgi:hypothetical protein
MKKKIKVVMRKAEGLSEKETVRRIEAAFDILFKIVEKPVGRA